jgi:hypothetical protein
VNPKLALSFLFGSWCALRASELPLAHFRAVELDSHIEIGYGVTVADVDGDHKPDILLADKKQIVWYRNPDWQKFVIAENLTPLDNVCIAASDIDGDGKSEIAVGAQWNPSDTLNSGAVFYLIAPADRTQKWSPVELPHEPTVHRMRWMRKQNGQFELVVVPLHGRGNQGGQGAGVRILSYQKPAEPNQPWKTEPIDAALHMTHNFELLKASEQPTEGMLVAASEGIFKLVKQTSGWVSTQLVGRISGDTNFNGAGEVRTGKLADGSPFFATVEPMHGNLLVVYTPPLPNEKFWNRHLLESSLKEGHALACGDLLRSGSDQIVVGWRAKNNAGKVGIKIFSMADSKTQNWSSQLIDDDTMACEDLCLADLNGDGKTRHRRRRACHQEPQDLFQRNS